MTVGGKEPTPTGLETVAAWRLQVLEKVFVYMFVVLATILLLESLESLKTGEWHALPALSVSVVIQGVAAFAKRSSPRLRAASFAAAAWFGIGTSLPVLGFALPIPFLAAGMTLTLLALCVGQRVALINLAVLVGILLVVAFIVCNVQHENVQAVLAQDRKILDQKYFPNWIRVIAAFAAIALVVISSIGFLARRLGEAVAHNSSLFSRLQQETHDKIRALEERHVLEDKAKRAGELQLIGMLSASVAHDFNNLLMVILGNATPLKDAAQGSAKEHLEEIEEAAERAADLCRRLLTLGRERISEIELVDLNRLIEAELPILRTLASSQVKLEWNPGPPLWLEAARTEIRQLLLNLCANARDAMPEGGRIRISTERVERAAPGETTPAKYACLVLSDEGIGMDSETRERIFEPFFTTKGKTAGTGLGMSVVLAAVEQHAGFLEVASAPGQGTTFSIFFPLSEAPEAGSPEPATAPRASLFGREQVLIVDDDEGVRKVLRRCLENHGYTVLSASDGEEALALLARTPSVDLVISDAVMPKMGGRELFDALSSERPSLPFLFCSGHALGTIAPSILEEPHRALLSKPFSERALLLKVRQLLDCERPVRT